jgi:hypothetical protein
MNSIEITIRLGDRSTSDGGQVKWKEVQERRVLVSGEHLDSMKAEALRMAAEEMKRLKPQ